jgi:tetratricopeptide (TPR) repeat protein
LFRAQALEASERRAPARAEVLAAMRLADQMTLSPDWLYLLAHALVRHGRVDRAEALLDRARASAADPTAVSGVSRGTTGDSVALDKLQGEIALARGRAAEALQHFDTAHRLAPDAVTREALGRVNLALGRRDDAVAWFEELIETGGSLGSEGQQAWLDAHLRLGELHEQAGRPHLARTFYEKVLAIWKDADPDLPAARDARTRLARLAG